MSLDSNQSCVSCLRDPQQKYCYNKRTGIGLCCELEDEETSGCSSASGSNIFCSTDKGVALSSGFEVCPHKQDQCDTRTLELNNATWGERASDRETIEATRALEKMEEEPFSISPSMFDGWTSARSTKTSHVTSSVNENSG